KNHDQDKVNEISEKLMENPELAKLIGELSTSTDNASDLVKGLLQASINAGLQAEMDVHLGYTSTRPNATDNLRQDLPTGENCPLIPMFSSDDGKVQLQG